jgi:hypothetical protein
MATTKREIKRASDIYLGPAAKKSSTPLDKFISELTKAEGGKSSVSIGNVREIIQLANKKLGGIIYAAIKLKK